MIYPPKMHIRILGLLMFTAFAESAVAQVTTTPVGFTTLTMAAKTTQAVAIPLDSLPDYQGAISSLSGATINASSTGWTNTSFGPYVSNPYIIRFLSGISKGRQLKISSNTTSSLTVVLPNGVSDVASLAAPNDTFELMSVDTLASFFGTGASSGLLTGTDPAAVDNVLIRTSVGSITYYNDGSHWLRVGGDGSSQDSLGLLSDSGVLFVRRASTALNIVVTGQVPTTNLVTDFNAASSTLFANRFPVDASLVSLGLDALSNWVKGSNPDAVDNVWLRTSVGWISYYHDGTNWLRVGGDGTAQNPLITSNSAVLVVHRGNQILTLNQALPYSL